MQDAKSKELIAELKPQIVEQVKVGDGGSWWQLVGFINDVWTCGAKYDHNMSELEKDHQGWDWN